MGKMEDILKMLPGVGGKMKDVNIDPKHMARTEAIVYSMTEKERKEPNIINQSRKNRIARGAGVKLNDVNGLIKQFTDMKKMMRQFSNMDPKQMERAAAQMQRGGAGGMGMPGMPGGNRAARRGKGKGKGKGGFKF